VPDVAANADPASGYRVFGRGQWVVGAGTSAAAPVWAGLVALLNQMRGQPLGLITPWLYRRRSELVRAGALRAVRKGEEGGRASRHSWNWHTGLGVPEGEKLAAAMPPAGG
jgi:kumamolisin